MENLSEVIEQQRLPLDIRLADYLWDHRFDGRAVLPAVEAMQLLARSAQGADPQRDVYQMVDAAFERFLYLEEMTAGRVLEAFNDLQLHSDGSLTATLATKHRSPKLAATRFKQHVRLKFPAPDVSKKITPPPFEDASRLQGSVFEVAPEEIYRDLVPFGSAYQNIQSTLQIAESAAVAEIKSPSYGCDTRPLGSPFPLDAALHAACVWGQRFSTLVAFPTGFRRRCILRPTRSGESYRARVQFDPERSTAKTLVFDLWIIDTHGHLRETLSGLRMQDVSGGRLKPGGWIKEGL